MQKDKIYIKALKLMYDSIHTEVKEFAKFLFKLVQKYKLYDELYENENLIEFRIRTPTINLDLPWYYVSMDVIDIVKIVNEEYYFVMFNGYIVSTKNKIIEIISSIMRRELPSEVKEKLITWLLLRN